MPLLALILSQLQLNFDVFILAYSLSASLVHVQYSLMKGELVFVIWELWSEKQRPETNPFFSNGKIITLISEHSQYQSK